MKKGLLTMAAALICAMACAFGLAACNNGEPNENGGEQTVAVESVTLDKTELTLEIGGEETLTATVAPDDATDKAVTWSSDNTAVATVENGKVTAIAAGTAAITAKAGDKTAACTVTVNAPAPTTITGSYYMIETSETGWQPNTQHAIVFRADGTCDANGAGIYTIENGVITIVEDNGSMTVYATIDGNIMWMFANKDDTSDISKTIQPFYSETVITDEDREMFVELFGDGVTGGDKEESYTVTAEEWNEALDLKYKNLTFTGTISGASGEMTLKLIEDGSIHQISSGDIDWGEHIYRVNSDKTVSYFLKTDTGWEAGAEGSGYDTLQEYEQGNYGDDFGFMKEIIPAAKYNSSFVFDETDNSYKGTVMLNISSDGALAFDMTAKFENKNLVFLDFSAETEGVTYSLTVRLFDYGTTEIEFPAV